MFNESGDIDKSPGETKQRQELHIFKSPGLLIWACLGPTSVFCEQYVFAEIRTLFVVFLVLVVVLLSV